MTTPAPGPVPAETQGRPAAVPPASDPPVGELDMLFRSLLAFFAIGFVAWLALAWQKYGTQYAQSLETWRKGSKQLIEITLVREDKQGLFCASDRTFDGLACAFRADGKTESPTSQDDPHLLRPYNTIKNELFLGAGLWSSPGLTPPLPSQRFSVVCAYEIVGVVKSVSLRWGATAAWDPAKQTVPVGILSDCVIPR